MRESLRRSINLIWSTVFKNFVLDDIVQRIFGDEKRYKIKFNSIVGLIKKRKKEKEKKRKKEKRTKEK